MAGKIEATVAPTEFMLVAGESTEAVLTLRNLGQSVDQLTLQVEGLDPSWYTLPVSSVALFPNDQDNLKIILHPPKTDEAKAGSYPFRFKVTSQENPDETASVDLAIQIRALPELELQLSPQRVTGRKGIYKIVVNNPGDSGTSLRLEASDAQGILRYYLRPESLNVPGGGRSESELEVRLGWMAFFGGEKEFNFEVQAELPEAEESKTISGQLVRIPWYKTLPRLPRLPRVQLSRIRLPWLTRPPAIGSFKATTDDRREFKLSWSVKRARVVKLDDEEVDREGDRVVSPIEVTSYVLTADNRYGSTSQTVEVQPRPLPEAKVSERIRASLSPAELQTGAGGAPVSAMLQVQNLGEIVDKFLVEVEGLDETWYSRSASSIALMPQATDQVQISFQPPKKKGVKSKAYPFAVIVSSQSSPEEVTSVVGQLEVLPSVEFKLGVRPYRVSCRRKGTFRISLANTGVSGIDLALEATDLDEGLRFRFKNENPTVAAWNTIEVPMITKPKRGGMVGEKKRYDITVTAIAGDGNPQSVNCELYHSPFIGSWRRIWRVIRILIFLAILGVVIYYVLQWGGGWGMLRSDPQEWVGQLVRTVERFVRGIFFR